MLTTSDFDFELPPDLIASHPLPQRDASRMLVVNDGKIQDKHIRDF
ncbi:MAG: S-adenosylmethionine:tRNA ribosyltransferase-isomerase [Alphaproteobacteria bacterium]|nr:S-adenosylmethionine:tRNA ribosyltransferase-isomerase [Alphaproteobacteria bacterium]